MRRGILVGGACFLLGAMALALAQTTGMRPDQFVAAAWTWTGVQTFADGKLSVGGATSGNSIIKAPATGGGTVTLPVGTGTLGFGGGAQALTLVSTQTASGGASLAWTGLDTSASGSNTLLVDCNGITLQSTNNSLFLQVGTGPTPTYQTSGYYYNTIFKDTSAATITGQQGESGSAIAMPGQYQTGTGNAINYWLQVSGLATANYKLFSGKWTIYGSNSHFVSGTTDGTWHGATTALTAIRLVTANADNITGGQCSLYKLTP
jgi:hypothetical protein